MSKKSSTTSPPAGEMRLRARDSCQFLWPIGFPLSSAHIFARVTADPDKPEPRKVSARADDLVTVERGVMNALRDISQK